MPFSAWANPPPSVLVKMDEGLGVGRGPVDVALGDQLVAEAARLILVVKLAVIRDPDRAVLVGHRLGAAGQVDDREPAVPERGGAVDVEAVAVGPSVGERRRHPREDFTVGRRPCPR